MGTTDRTPVYLINLGGVPDIPQHALYQATDPHGDYYDPDPR